MSTYSILVLHCAEEKYCKYHGFTTPEEAHRFAHAEGMPDWADVIELCGPDGSPLEDFDMYASPPAALRGP